MQRSLLGSLKTVSAFFLSGTLLAGATATALAQTQTFNVRLSNYAIAGAPATVQAGAQLRFNATSMGFPHNLAIDGNGVDLKPNEPNLTDGQTGVITLQAPAQPGSYNLYCPVGRHREQGMVVPITVVAGAVALPRTGAAAVATEATRTGTAALPAGLTAAGLAAGGAGIALRRRRNTA